MTSQSVSGGSSFWEEGVTLPEMGFYLSCKHLLRGNTGVFDPGRGRWVNAPLPMPLVFGPASASGCSTGGCPVSDVDKAI